MARRVFLVVLILSWLAANLLLGGEWEFYALGDLGGDEGFGRTSRALGVSGDGGLVVGDSLATAGLGITTGTEALMWVKPDARLRRLGTLTTKNPYSSARAVSLQGLVVVGESNDAEGKRADDAQANIRAFRWTQAAGIVSLGVLPGHDQSVAWGVSGDGTIVVGESSSLEERLAFRWMNGTMSELGDLPGGERESTALAISLDGSTVVGYSSSANGTEACLWTTADMRGLGSLDGDRFVSRAFAVSSNGKVVVGDSHSPRGPEAFRWTQQTGIEPLGDLPGGLFESKATGVSADGNTIVGTATSERGSEAFIWTAAEKMRPLEQVLCHSGVAAGWRLQEATGISSDGTVIVGVGQNPRDKTEGWVARRQKPQQ